MSIQLESAGPMLEADPAVYQSRRPPRVIVVDDDPLFCKTMSQLSQGKNLDLTTCRTTGDVLALDKSRTFDVAILDYKFGELSAYQVADLMGRDIPILLVSQSDRAEVHYRDWPFDVREFMPKSRGIATILNRAVGIAAREEGPITVVKPTPVSTNYMELGVWAALTFLVLLWLLSAPSASSPAPMFQILEPERIDWDANEVKKPGMG